MNGDKQVILSQAYSSVAKMENGVWALKVLADDGQRYEVKKDYFLVHATNGEVIGKSVRDPRAAELVQWCQKYIPDAPLLYLFKFKNGVIECFNSGDRFKQYYCRLRDANYIPLMVSPAKTSKESVLELVPLWRSLGKDIAPFSVEQRGKGSWVFVLKDGDTVVAESELHPSKEAAHKVLPKVMRLLPDAKVSEDFQEETLDLRTRKFVFPCEDYWFHWSGDTKIELIVDEDFTVGTISLELAEYTNAGDYSTVGGWTLWHDGRSATESDQFASLPSSSFSYEDTHLATFQNMDAKGVWTVRARATTHSNRCKYIILYITPQKKALAPKHENAVVKCWNEEVNTLDRYFCKVVDPNMNDDVLFTSYEQRSKKEALAMAKEWVTMAESEDNFVIREHGGNKNDYVIYIKGTREGQTYSAHSQHFSEKPFADSYLADFRALIKTAKVETQFVELDPMRPRHFRFECEHVSFSWSGGGKPLTIEIPEEDDFIIGKRFSAFVEGHRNRGNYASIRRWSLSHDGKVLTDSQMFSAISSSYSMDMPFDISNFYGQSMKGTWKLSATTSTGSVRCDYLIINAVPEKV
eukprot:TRINITY_DN19519_c0_g1_i1.p1 TRINITY_DN19519_c0_g1~~TRINITY_DN19519_c0_g1_i1.p1  ORF type:complete len:670 (+),score=150.76 TRINITY_DN19519_c0_g1_i1:273-2012(+)